MEDTINNISNPNATTINKNYNSEIKINPNILGNNQYNALMKNNSNRLLNGSMNSYNAIQKNNPNILLNNVANPYNSQINVNPYILGDNQYNSTQNNNQNNLIAPNPQSYQENGNNSSIDFNQIISAYQKQFGNESYNNYNTESGIKKTSIGTTIVTPTTSNLNSLEGQYQSAFSDTINSLISQMINTLNEGFEYDPTTDNSLKVASEYAANSTLQNLAGSGVLNSSATSERVARIISELIPQYEEKAHSRWVEYLGQLADTAQLVMNFDNQQFAYWKDAKDREFQEKEFEYQKQQDALENAWKRVDELGYVDNEASTILGIKVGTLSGEARKAKEQREFELQKMREQAQIEHENNIALAKIRSELDLNNSKALAEYNSKLEKDMYNYKSSVDAKNNKNSSNTSTTSLNTYKDIINNRWTEYDEFSKKYTTIDNDGIYNYLWNEYNAGRLSQSDLSNLVAMYGVTTPTQSNLSTAGQDIYNTYKNFYQSSSKTTNIQNQIINSLSGLKNNGAITASDYNYILQNLGF